MAVKIQATVGYEMPRGWETSERAKKAFWRLMRQAVKAAAGLWAKNMLPKHFKQEAYGLYPVYFRRGGGKRGSPLVDAGDLKRAVLSTAPQRITQRAARNTAVARVRMTTQQQFKQRKIPEKRYGKGQNPLAGWRQYRKELEATSDAEVLSLKRFVDQYMQTAIMRDTRRRRKPLV